MKALEQIAQKIAKKFECSWDIALEELTITIEKEHILKLLAFLRDSNGMHFRQLSDICGVDYLTREKRFEVVYHLLSMGNNLRIRVKVPLAENEAIDSCIGLFAGANWWEREAWDMYGIVFTGHNDLRRLLSDYNFDGFPLRKDFPLSGHTELHYDEEESRIVKGPVQLQQAYREFDFQGPWQGMQEHILPGDEKAEVVKKEKVTSNAGAK